MGRVLAIDYGRKRTGLAVTDPLKIIANGLETVRTHDLMNFLYDYFAKEDVELVVIGYPRRLNNQASDATPLVDTFVKLFKKKFEGIETFLIDERFTSKMAFQAMIDGGLKKQQRRDKALVDKVSATIILQSYLEQSSNA